jgi:hypothetical protein
MRAFDMLVDNRSLGRHTAYLNPSPVLRLTLRIALSTGMKASSFFLMNPTRPWIVSRKHANPHRVLVDMFDPECEQALSLRGVFLRLLPRDQCLPRCRSCRLVSAHLLIVFVLDSR